MDKRWTAALVAALAALSTWSAMALAERPRDAGQSATTVSPAAVDKIFARYNTSTPGCAVGVSSAGTPVLTKGYGSADLEHDVPITPDTIFEAGSVSKQFTAAAVLLLARAGKLSLDDPVRKYVPELPEYPQPLLIRHMLNHTSGLRDWGSVAAIGGWPRGSRTHTHAHVLDIVSRQRGLNFTPGTRWSYSNTGFNLAAIIVSRVSGVPFADFTRDRVFKPAGMTHTSWRDDFTRIVKGRAVAYAERDGVFHTEMPFENVYGNGGLLTTVGDLLKWNENFTKPVVGDAAFVAEQQQAGHFNDGRTHGYALGLFIDERQGLREVHHSGSTAGYSAFLTRFPDQKLSAVVLCNVATNATRFAHEVTDLYLAGQLKPSKVTATYTLTPADVTRITGLYLNVDSSVPMTIAAGGDTGLQIENGPPLVPLTARRVTTTGGDVLTFDGSGGMTVVDEFGTTDRFQRAQTVTPSPQALLAYTGVYESDEAETLLTAKVDGDRLVLTQRPDRTLVLTPIAADVFRTRGLGIVKFHRDGAGRVDQMSVVQDRVWNMPFRKSTPARQSSAAGRP